MANIKVDLSLGQKIANPFKTTRKSTTNPFQYKDFEGNTLDVSAFADVFEGSSKKTNKLKMITSSVAGSMTKLHASITEPIVNFVNRVRGGISNAWEYAKNTNITTFGSYKPITDILNADIVELGKGISHSITDRISIINNDIIGIGKGLGENITGLGKGLSENWTTLISKLHGSKITKDMSVAELHDLWIKENELTAAHAAKEIALIPDSAKKVKVA